MEESGRVLDEHEIVVQRAPGDESILVLADEVVELRSKAEGEGLGEDLCNQVDEADRAVVIQLARVCPLG
jgi:hypothetical protein